MSQDFSGFPPNGPNFNPGGPPGSGPFGGAPDNYMIFAVLSTIFCCFIPGIISIIYACQVNGKHYAGDIEGAKAASRGARTWAIIAVAVAAISMLIVIFYTGTGLLSLIGLAESESP